MATPDDIMLADLQQSPAFRGIQAKRSAEYCIVQSKKETFDFLGQYIPPNNIDSLKKYLGDVNGPLTWDRPHEENLEIVIHQTLGLFPATNAISKNGFRNGGNVVVRLQITANSKEKKDTVNKHINGSLKESGKLDETTEEEFRQLEENLKQIATIQILFYVLNNHSPICETECHDIDNMLTMLGGSLQVPGQNNENDPLLSLQSLDEEDNSKTANDKRGYSSSEKAHMSPIEEDGYPKDYRIFDCARKLRCIIIVCLVFTAIVLVVVTALFVMSLQTSHNMTVSMCQEDDTGIPGLLQLKNHAGKQVFCGSTLQDTEKMKSQMLKIALNNYKPKEKLKTFIKHAQDLPAKTEEAMYLKNIHTPVAHLTGIFFNESRSEVKWRQNYGRWGRLENGFRLDETQLVVPFTGVYKIYGSLKFCEQEKNNLSHIPYEMSIHKIDGVTGETMRLLQSQSSVTKSQLYPTNEVPLYASGLFYLSLNDRLEVRAKHMQALKIEKNGHYFGAHLIY